MIHKNAIGKEYPFFRTTYKMRLLAGDASLYDVICRRETVLPFAIERRLNACGAHLGSPNFFSSLGVHIYIGRPLSAEDETTAAPKLRDTGKQRSKNGPTKRKIPRRATSSFNVMTRKLRISREEL
jgi:hypothetical protein